MLAQSDFTFQVERFADIQLLRYQVPGFRELTLRQKLLIYHLSRAALLGRDILWDQNGACNLRLRKVLETIYMHYQGDRSSKDFQQFTTYLKRVWFSNGIHHHYGYQKFIPGFSEQFLINAARESGLDATDLIPIIFDPSILSKRVNQAHGEDLLLTSASNYYQDGITQAEAEDFYVRQKEQGDQEHPVMYGMNSRLEKKPDGTLYENVWRSGGMYGRQIDRIIAALRDAIPYAENKKQQAVIEKLVEFYRTGDLKTFDEYTILWVQDTESQVDFTNGFTEVYGDPLGLKASWEGYVNFVDPIATRRSKALSDNAQWFEDHSPIAPCFRKKECRGVSAKVINAAILGGDLYPSSAIGINLPNSNWVRAVHGSKSVTIGNLTHAYNEAAKGSGLRQEFVIDQPTIELLDKYGNICDDLHTDLHECLGHGSGQLLPGVDPDALKAYGSTIEEARADLFGLYYLADEKLVELGLTPNAEAYKAQYYSYLMNGALTQLVRIEEGDRIEEAHMRNRALIARWTLKNFPQAAELTEKDGKHYIQVHSYPMLRTAFATLLAEIQRIKSEGDLAAARQLTEEFGVQVENDLHQEVLRRYRKLNISPYKGFINPRYELVRDESGKVTDVEIYYDEDYDQQMLRYGKL
ncbi:MAG: dihydrofolate reductase [Bacteroidaceae bacterium]|nr:dihydrofolate reductase [Bacteroidaceae bacterium]